MSVASGRAQRGLTLVEVLVSVAVMSFVSLSLMSMISSSLLLDKLAEERSIATALATERLGQISSLDFQEPGDYANYKRPEETLVTGPPIQFVTDYDTIPDYPDSRRVVELQYGEPLPGMLTVKTTVWWRHVGQPERSHTMITFLHPGLN